jgi:hypothetical protein
MMCSVTQQGTPIIGIASRVHIVVYNWALHNFSKRNLEYFIVSRTTNLSLLRDVLHAMAC